ncbi:hypothetical protein D3C84_520300 [compost metagenome]
MVSKVHMAYVYIKIRQFDYIRKQSLNVWEIDIKYLSMVSMEMLPMLLVIMAKAIFISQVGQST